MNAQAEIAALLQRMAQAITQPRVSVRWALGRFNEIERLSMIGLGIAMQAVIAAFMSLVRPDAIAPLAMLGPVLIISAVIYLAGSTITAGVGRNRGREIPPEHARDLFAWWMLATTIMAPLGMLSVLGEGVALMVQLFVLVMSVRVLACFIAEAYGYSDIISVVFAMIGITLLLSFVASILLLSIFGVPAPAP